jgi:hypothetical protein
MDRSPRQDRTPRQDRSQASRLISEIEILHHIRYVIDEWKEFAERGAKITNDKLYIRRDGQVFVVKVTEIEQWPS